MASYRVQVWSTDITDFSTNKLVAEIENPKNLGFGSYINDIGEAYFTVSQYDAKVNIRSHEGTGHVFIIRDDGTNEDVVWRGILAEHDANENDVIFYAYGYEHFLFSLHSKWKTKWKGVPIAGATGRPIDDLWDFVSGLNNSPLGFVTKGTLQAPWVSDAQTTALTLNRYKVNWKPVLTAFKELVAIAVSDTNNIVYFEIDYPTDPTDHSATFNFWRDNSSSATKLRLEYPSNIMDWSDRFVPVMLRNKTLGVGSGPRNQLYRYQRSQTVGTYGRTNFGLRSQNMYLSWVRDRKELKRVTRRRLKLGLREDTNVWVRCYPDSVPPWRSTYSDWEPGDLINVQILHGATRIDKQLLMVGEQVVYVNGREYVQPMLEDRADLTTEAAGASYAGMVWHGATSSTPWTVAAPIGSGSDTRSIMIPTNSRIAIFCYVISDDRFNPTVSGVTLDGVAGTLIDEAAGTGGFDRRIGMYFWAGNDVPEGQTVDLVVSYTTPATGSHLGYGLLTGESDIASPTQLDSANGSGSSGGAAVTLDAGANSGFGATVTIHSPLNYTALAGNTQVVANAVVGARRMSVSYEDADATGSRSVGLTGNTVHTIQGVMMDND